MESNIYSQIIYKKSITFSYNNFRIDTLIDSGKNYKKSGFMFISDYYYDPKVLDILKEKNILSNIKYVDAIINKLSTFNKLVYAKNIIFSAVVNYDTHFINIEKEQYQLYDYRSFGYAKLILSDKRRRIYYKTIEIKSDVNDMLKKFDDSFEVLLNEVTIALKAREAKLKNNQILDLVFSPEAAGYLIHEVFGHMLEIDYVVNKLSVFSELSIGNRVSIEELSIIDDPNIFQVTGLTNIDDAGEKVEPIELISKGILNSFLGNVQLFGSFMQNNRSGCYRSQSYKYNPLPRMRNTFVANNEKGLNMKEIINITESGIFIDKIYDGEVNLLEGKFILSCGIGYKIENGVLGDALFGANIIGDIKDTLYSIDHIGKDLKMTIGHCVKSGQVVIVGMGSPTLRVKNLVIGDNLHV